MELPQKEINQALWNSMFQLQTQNMWDSMFRLAMSLCHNRSRAEDCTQEALLRAIKYFPKFVETHFQCSDPILVEKSLNIEANRTYLKHWLLKITKNVFLNDAMELDKWSSKTEDNADLEAIGDTAVSGSQSVGLVTLGNEESDFFGQVCDDGLYDALGSLNSKQRTLLYLSAEGFSYREMSDLLEIPMGTVMSTLSRAILKVKLRLGTEQK